MGDFKGYSAFSDGKILPKFAIFAGKE